MISIIRKSRRINVVNKCSLNLMFIDCFIHSQFHGKFDYFDGESLDVISILVVVIKANAEETTMLSYKHSRLSVRAGMDPGGNFGPPGSFR